MKTVYFKLTNPPTGVSVWEAAFTKNPSDPSLSNWQFTGFQTLSTTLKATIPDDVDIVAFYIGLPGQQNVSYKTAFQTDFINGSTYVWDSSADTLTLPSGGTPPASTGSDFMEMLKKNALPIGIGVVLLGVVLTRRK